MYWTSLKKKTVSEFWKYLQMNCALKYSLHFRVFWKMSLDYETDFVFGISLPCFCLSEIITVQIPWLCTRVFVYQKGWAPLRARIEIAHMELTLHHCKFRLWRVSFGSTGQRGEWHADLYPPVYIVTRQITPPPLLIK